MKIVQLDIQGFRSLKNVTWRPGDLNVVIGPNGSGKSNLLRMLELVSASAQGNLEKLILASGSIQQILWDGRSRELVFSLITSGINNENNERGIIYNIGIESKFSNSKFFSSEYSIEKETLVDASDNFKLIDKAGLKGNVFGREDNQIVEVLDSHRETIFSFARNPMLEWMSTNGLSLYGRQIADWMIYQDIRTDQNAVIRQAPVSRLEQRVAPDGQNLINVLHTLYASDRKFKQDINDAMFAAFGEDFDELIFPPAADQRIQMRVRWKTLKREQSTADLSDGTLRFLFLLTVLAGPNPPPLVAIDEPETGLHPSMLPIIAEYAVEAATRTQVIFTTHSDQFLSAFRDTKPTVTVAKWENGETTLTTLDDSELEYWLKDYSLGTLFRSGELENMAA